MSFIDFYHRCQITSITGVGGAEKESYGMWNIPFWLTRNKDHNYPLSLTGILGFAKPANPKKS